MNISSSIEMTGPEAGPEVGPEEDAVAWASVAELTDG